MIDKALSNKISNMGVVCAMSVVMTHVFPKVEVRSFTWCVDRFIFDGVGLVAVPYFFIVGGFFLARHINESGWYLIHPFIRFLFRAFIDACIDCFTSYASCVILAILAPIVVKCVLLAISARLTSFVFGGR